MKLNLGCGTKKLPGWVNIDSVAEFSPDLLHDISMPLPYEDESVDEVLAEDILEHFDKYHRFLVFYEWVRVIKVGGVMTIGVPNLHKILRRYSQLRLRFNFDSFFNRIFGETMWNQEIYIGHLGVHKWGYTQKTLKNFIRQFGMETIKVDKIHSNLRLAARKGKHVSREEIEKIEIYPSGKRTGFSISVKEAQERILRFKIAK